jgi:hypothetical protein
MRMIIFKAKDKSISVIANRETGSRPRPPSGKVPEGKSVEDRRRSLSLTYIGINHPFWVIFLVSLHYVVPLKGPFPPNQDCK